MEHNKPNKLIHEKSPYLLQHAYNPVDWYPWGEEAFMKARTEDKPIFLSIGYSTCYWCHVMEREVFENDKIAEIMNQLFVNIKVDREERPDIDRVYMTALQAMTGSGGWPMSIFLTPELKPFYGATYIPPVAKYGQSGFPDVIKGIDNAWKNRREEILNSGNKIISYLESLSQSKTEYSELNESIFYKCFRHCEQVFDDVYGGFGGAPKFPRPVLFNFLLRYYNRYKEQKALDMVTFTLEKMAKGGDYDQLGGGFHRYSVDKFWRVPHFEKMLYDQAQLAISYIEAYQLTGDSYFAEIAKDILNYVDTNLTDKATGGFYSAEDAESPLNTDNPIEKREGEFYVWEKKEIIEVLGEKNGDIVSYYFDIGERGNVPAGSDPHNVFTNKNILYISKSISETANHFNLSTDETDKIITESKRILYKHRAKRPVPHLDDKVLVSWNALMISAYAKAYQVFYEEKYLNSANCAADFIIEKLYNHEEHILLHRWRDGEARFEGTLSDYAFFVQSLIDLYETCFDNRYLEIALKLIAKTIELFYDAENDGFFDVSGNDKSILVKTKEDYDSAEPTGNSIAILNLLRLAQFIDSNELYEKAEKSLKQFSGKMSSQPFAMPQMLCTLDYYLNKPKQIIIAGKKDNRTAQEMIREVQQRFIPNKVLIYTTHNEKNKLIPFLDKIIKPSEKTLAYVCENYACKLPVESVEELKKLLF